MLQLAKDKKKIYTFVSFVKGLLFMSSTRHLKRISFYCDGHYTVLSSASRGGKAISDADLAEALSGTSSAGLIESGVVMPLVFEGDCALGDVVVVVGELGEREAAEWVARLSSRLQIPCGKLLVLAGGGDPYDWENAASTEPDDDSVFAWVAVPPGEYLVELYAFASSMTAAHHFQPEAFREWFARTRPGMAPNDYVQALCEGNGYDLNDSYLDYLIRLKPWSESDVAQLTSPEDGWLSKFFFRQPELCPLGIRYVELGL